MTTGTQKPALGWLDEHATRDGTLRSSTIPKLAERFGRPREAREIGLRRSRFFESEFASRTAAPSIAMVCPMVASSR